MAEQEHSHPPYILIWVVLLVLTLAEVAMSLYMTNVSKVVLAVGLIFMAVWKAALVRCITCICGMSPHVSGSRPRAMAAV